MNCKYVVTKRHAGLGDLLISLSSAWWYAKCTNRQVIIDWRNSTYDADRFKNLMTDILNGPQEIGGVKMQSDIGKLDTLESIEFYPNFWNLQNLDGMVWETQALNQAQCELVRNGQDRPESVVVFSECLPSLMPDKTAELCFFNQLRFSTASVQIANNFAATHFGEKTVIGIHLRHGNGGNIMGHTPYWENPSQSLAKCMALLKKCIDLCGEENYIIFLATDSRFVEQNILSIFPNTVLFPKKYRLEGAGELHRGNKYPNALQEALVEMLLLAKSHLLIRFPPSSFFTHYASLTKPKSKYYSEAILRFCAADLSPQILF